MRLAGRDAALIRTLALQRLEGAAQRRLGPQAAYPSYWRARWSNSWPGDHVGLPAGQDSRFLTPTPNVGAGMGHQVVTWCAGWVLADVLGLRFAHTPVAEPWESHLNLAAGEVSARDLRATARTVRLPLVKYESSPVCEVDHAELARVAASYKSDPAIVFRLALDQARYDVTSAGRALMEKYWLGRRRKAPSTQLRIAVHVRRGDVAAMREAGHEQWVKRWLDLSYFEAVLSSIDAVVGPRARQVVLVSEGDPSDFSTLVRSFGAELVLGGDPTAAFDRLVDSDVLVASPSGFSFIAGLVSQAITLFPAQWWHAIPDEPRWIRVKRDLPGIELDLRDHLPGLE